MGVPLFHPRGIRGTLSPPMGITDTPVSFMGVGNTPVSSRGRGTPVSSKRVGRGVAVTSVSSRGIPFHVKVHTNGVGLIPVSSNRGARGSPISSPVCATVTQNSEKFESTSELCLRNGRINNLDVFMQSCSVVVYSLPTYICF